MPLYRMLGGADGGTPVYGAGGWLSWRLEEVIAEAQRFQAAGYHGYKMRIGSRDWREDVRRVRAVREAVGTNFALMVDVNQAWSVETSLRAGRELESADLTWIEEPVEAEDLTGSHRVADELLTPIAVGETVWGTRGFQRLLDEPAGDVIQLDLMRCGGITRFLAITAMVEARRLPVTSHLFTPISAHLMATTPAAYMVEHLPSWFDPLFEQGPLIEGGRIHPSRSPGLGLTIAEPLVSSWEVR
jgi:L-alanine-DL-glutamate epimerase-like enolase superfamily enzyme